MRINTKAYFWIFVAIALPILLFTGSDDHQKVDDIQILSILGFDVAEGAGMKGAGFHTDYSHQSKPTVLHAEAKKTKLILDQMNRQSSMPVEIGKLSLLLISKPLAERGIDEIVRSLCMDPLIDNIMLAVSEEPVEKVMEKLESKESHFLPLLLEQNMLHSELPPSNLRFFLYDYAGNGRDASVPYLAFTEKDEAIVQGYAVFDEDRLKLILDVQEMYALKVLQGQSMVGLVSFPLERGGMRDIALFRGYNGSRTRELDTSGDTPRITYHIQLRGAIKDYPKWVTYRDRSDQEYIRRELEEYLEQQLQRLLKKFQSKGVDPLGIGDYVRAYDRHWEERAFYAEEYPKLPYEVDVKLKLTEGGIDR